MPTGFRLIPAHSVSTLAKALAAQISRRENPLRPETVLVMNYAQRVWLQHFLAETLGICANLRFISPESFLQNLVAAPDSRIFERNTLAWRIFETLKRTHKPEAGTPENLRFFSGEKSDEDILLLSHNLGDLFWRYQSFRPKMIVDWTRNASPPRQSEPDFLFEFNRQKNLWNELRFGNATPPAKAWMHLLQSNIPPEKIPPRIFAFAPSALPRLHVELLEKLAESSEVFLYYHHLSHDLWTETTEKKKLLRQQFRKPVSETSDCAFPPEEGNELLAAWGKAARPLAAHFIDSGLLDADSSVDQPPERDSLLHAIQREIRDNSAAPAPYVPAKNDRSFRILAAPSAFTSNSSKNSQNPLRFFFTTTIFPTICGQKPQKRKNSSGNNSENRFPKPPTARSRRKKEMNCSPPGEKPPARLPRILSIPGFLMPIPPWINRPNAIPFYTQFSGKSEITPPPPHLTFPRKTTAPSASSPRRPRFGKWKFCATNFCSDLRKILN